MGSVGRRLYVAAREIFRGALGRPITYKGARLLQIAIFVDAGYVYAQGSALLAGQKQPRNTIKLNIPEILNMLAGMVEMIAPHARLLRTYWYDGLRREGRSAEQAAVAQSANAKLRLGMVNSRGEQKGVDSLIVTDLIELARNHAISDALLLAGDEDIRVGVQIAQSFGVRVHLLGIKPARGSQSPELIFEADTHHEWDDHSVRSWMLIDAPVVCTSQASGKKLVEISGQNALDFIEATTKEIDVAVAEVDAVDLMRWVAHMDANHNQIPPEIDRRVLALIRNRLDRNLSDAERKEYRGRMASALREKASGRRDKQ